MENTEILDSTDYSGVTQEIRFTGESLSYIEESGKWCTFMAIVGFIYFGLSLIAILSTSAYFFSILPGGMGGGLGIFLALLILAIFVYPLVKLFFFAKHAKSAMVNTSSTDMAKSFKNLRSYFRFWGIITILIILLYVILFAIGGLM